MRKTNFKLVTSLLAIFMVFIINYCAPGLPWQNSSPASLDYCNSVPRFFFKPEYYTIVEPIQKTAAWNHLHLNRSQLTKVRLIKTVFSLKKLLEYFFITFQAAFLWTDFNIFFLNQVLLNVECWRIIFFCSKKKDKRTIIYNLHIFLSGSSVENYIWLVACDTEMSRLPTRPPKW